MLYPPLKTASAASASNEDVADLVDDKDWVPGQPGELGVVCDLRIRNLWCRRPNSKEQFQ
jgi:hypothetical protein